MLNEAFNNGFTAALARFKVAAIMPPAGTNPALNGQAAVAPNATSLMMPKAPSAPNAPVAAHASKANILG